MKPERQAIRRDGTPMSEEERKFLEAAFERIKRQLFSGRKPAKVVQFPAKLSEQEMLQLVEQDTERLIGYKERLEEQINERRRAQGLPSLRAARAMRNAETEQYRHWREPEKVTKHDPIEQFEKEMAGKRCHRGPLDSDSNL